MPVARLDAAPALASTLLSVHGDVGFRQVVTGGLALAMLCLGIAITVIAFQGYRRNSSRPMLFIALGFALIIASQLVGVVLLHVLGLNRFAARTAIQSMQLFGFASILYALRTDG